MARFSRLLFPIAAALLVQSFSAVAQDAGTVPATVTFVISGGYWEDDGDAVVEGQTEATAPATPAPSAEQPAMRRGYYRLISVRQPDRTAKVFLQQMAAGDDGPALVTNVELEEFTAIKPYVTDVRPEDSSGVSRLPGLFATVYLKTDPTSAEPESYTVLIDEFGEIRVEKATN
ncbi:hypothetical protein HGO38_09780 [Rhizobium sp. CG5]|uniref:hypothetical protein n=1 Tax=Rhizobium sp. CG5 TaxID=2726076 RepID=UPI002033FEBF|nr:hypothetical protein [Rhizobium sp. CG5]MCM2473762.1 hypothetical protein [Rhizobium sp. CG5]